MEVITTMNMNNFKEAIKNEAMKQEYTAFIEEKKPETLDALAETVEDYATSRGLASAKRKC